MDEEAYKFYVYMHNINVESTSTTEKFKSIGSAGIPSWSIASLTSAIPDVAKLCNSLGFNAQIS